MVEESSEKGAVIKQGDKNIKIAPAIDSGKNRTGGLSESVKSTKRPNDDKLIDKDALSAMQLKALNGVGLSNSLKVESLNESARDISVGEQLYSKDDAAGAKNKQSISELSQNRSLDSDEIKYDAKESLMIDLSAAIRGDGGLQVSTL